MDFTLLLVMGILTTMIFLYQNQQISQLRQQISDYDEVVRTMQFQLSALENSSPKTSGISASAINEHVQSAISKTQIFDDIREIYRRIDGAVTTEKQLAADIQTLSRRSLIVGGDSNVCVLSSFHGCPANTHSWGGFSLEFDTTAGQRTAPPGYVIGEPIIKAKGQWHYVYGEFCCSQQRHE